MGTWQRDSRDEDLALFHDMRRRERRNFLYLLADDVEASPSATPTRTGRELLPLDSEKNDFDWLLTPPSTPLFPSLDQDGPIVNLSQRRVLTRSGSVSRSARLSYPQEPSPKVIHCGNPSPKRPSTASSTSSSISTSRGRALSPSLTSRSSPTMRSSSPCRLVTPTGRNSAAAMKSSSRSLTPTLRRNNTSPSSVNRAGPVSGRSRGKSLSPKLGPWEPSLPGFSAEPPPNLRTCLSDRTIQRGVSHIPKSKARFRDSSAEMFDASSQSRWCADSPDGSGNWSLSYSNDHNSSQTSRASVTSYDDDVDMAESVLSGSTNPDIVSKRANVITSKSEVSSLRRSVLPAKRQMRSAGTSGDAMPFLSLAARKSYERQAVQRRNAQTMFRPLLSSAPVTSFYTSRHSSMHLRSSGPFVDSPAAQSSLHVPRSEGLNVETAIEVAPASLKCEQPACKLSLYGIQDTIEEEGECTLISEEESLGCQNNCGLREGESRLGVLKGHVNNLADGDKVSCLSTAEESKVTLVETNNVLHTNSEGTCALPPQGLNQAPVDDKAQHEDTSCGMDFGTIEARIFTESRVKARHTHLGAQDHASASTSTGLPKEIDLASEKSKVKENHIEDQKLAALGKAQPSYLGIGSLLSQHGSQRVLSDLGSFRKHSPMKGSYTRSHDNSLSCEKNGSCDSFMSDSSTLIRSLASALGSGQPADLESSGDTIVGNAYSEFPAVIDNSHSVERVSSSLERDLLKKGVPLCETSTGIFGDVLERDANSEASTSCTLCKHCDSSIHSGWQSVVTDVNDIITEVSSSEVCSDNTLVRVSTSDRSAQQDVLSIIASCAPRITMLDEDAVQYGCTEAACTGQSRRYSDACTAPRLAGETSSNGLTGDPKLTQLTGVALSKRSVTLEEATDTILFCSSVVHEIVYKAATLAIQSKEQKALKPLISRRDFVTLFGFSATDSRSNGMKTAKPARNRKRQPLANTTICETSSFVQKQRMVHRQTPAVTMRQSPMERIENAVMGNHEEMHTPKVSMLPKRKIKQGKTAKCRCSCCMM